MKLGLQSKYSGLIPVVIGCQKDSETTVKNRTQVIPVLLAVFRFAVYCCKLAMFAEKTS